jgi:hypothetical protein
VSPLFEFDIAGDRITTSGQYATPTLGSSASCSLAKSVPYLPHGKCQLAGRQVAVFGVAAEETRERILQVARRPFTDRCEVLPAATEATIVGGYR